MSSLQLSLLLFYEVSNIKHTSPPVSQKLAHNQYKPTNKTEYSLFHIPSPIIGLTELFSIPLKFENSSREIDTAKLT